MAERVDIGAATIYTGDCRDVLRSLPSDSVDSIVTDPPYGIAFMGRTWDYDVPGVDVWQECLRVLKPGGHLLAFAGTRTQHRMCCRIEDAGFEIRDMLAWVYASGFPKSLDVSKAIDRAAGAEREVVGVAGRSASSRSCMSGDFAGGYYMETAPATDAARQWSGWHTALKPALEPITLARRPLVGTVAENVLRHGTGALNVDGCRVEGHDTESTARKSATGTFSQEHRPWKDRLTGNEICSGGKGGRWPANFLHDGSDAVTDLLGDAARFYYCPKASKRDRDEGCEGLPAIKAGAMSGRETRPDKPTNHPIRTNHHPTVKPTDLMRYLCRLITPPGGVVLDPFCGSGSTGKAAALEGLAFIGIERDAAYVEIAQRRIAHAMTAVESDSMPLLEGLAS